MAPSETLPGHLGEGWHDRTLAALAGLAASDARISGFRVHGSAGDGGEVPDRWSDLDVLFTAAEPVTVAEDHARQIGHALSPVFAAGRGGNSSRYCVRLVLRDLRRIDVTAMVAASGQRDLAGAVPGQNPADAVTGLINDFRFDAVLAAVKAARGDVLISAHLTLQLARHLLVLAMLLRDRDAGTTHHRFGGSRWDAWVPRLAQAPAPYDRSGITAAIRSYSTMLEEIAAYWEPRPLLDNGPLLALLDAVERGGRLPDLELAEQAAADDYLLDVGDAPPIRSMGRPRERRSISYSWECRSRRGCAVRPAPSSIGRRRPWCPSRQGRRDNFRPTSPLSRVLCRECPHMCTKIE